jgi:hypothetical protein
MSNSHAFRASEVFATRRSRVVPLACDETRCQAPVFAPVPGPQQLDNHRHGEQLLYRDEVRAEYARGGVQ